MNKSVLVFIGTNLLLGGCDFQSQVPWYDDHLNAQYEQIDRIGLPHLDEVFFEDPALEAIRLGDPLTDEDELTAVLEDSLTNLRESVGGIAGFSSEQEGLPTPSGLADQWTPNAIYINLDEPVALEAQNGRPLEGEDSFDHVISLAMGRFLDDQIAVITRGLGTRFPYLASPRSISYKEDPGGSQGEEAEGE